MTDSPRESDDLFDFRPANRAVTAAESMDEMAAMTKTWIAFHTEQPTVSLAWFIQHYNDGELLKSAPSQPPQLTALRDYLEGDHDLDTRQEVVAKALEILASLPARPPQLTKEKLDAIAARVLEDAEVSNLNGQRTLQRIYEFKRRFIRQILNSLPSPVQGDGE